MNTPQRILKNTFSLLFSGIVAQLLGFIVIVYLARILGPGDFGKISFAMAIVIYFTLIANLGLPLLGTRQIARERGKIRDYLGSIITLRLCLAVVGFGLLLLTAFFLRKPLEVKYLIILYGLGMIPSALLLDWVFQGVEKMEYVGLGRIVASVVYLGLVLCFVRSSNQLLLIPCFLVAGNLLATGVLISIFVGSFGRPRFRFNLISWRSLLKVALPMGLSVILGHIMFNIDTVMLGFMKSNEEVGYYNAAFKIIVFLAIMRASYAETIYPLASNYYQTSLDSLKRLLQSSTKLMVTLALPLAIGGTILARPIMNLIFGTRYDNGIIALQILIWVAAIRFINVAYARGLLSCGGERRYARVVTVAVVGNIVLNFILIPPFGLIGAAIASVAMQIVMFIGFYAEFGKVMKIPFVIYLVKPLLACIVMSLFLYWGLNVLNLNVFLLIFAGASIYVVSFYLMRGITRQERSLIRGILQANEK